MNINVQRLIVEKAERLAARHAELLTLTSAPEIIAHGSYLRRLLREQDELDAVSENYEKLIEIEQEIAIHTDELNLAVGSYKEQLFIEIAKLNEQKDNLYAYLAETVSCGTETASARMELTAVGEGTSYLETFINMYASFAKMRGEKSICRSDENSAIITIENLYSELQYESGIHKIIQSSSKASASITIAVFKEIKNTELEISDSDIRIDVFHSSGAGGQNVNKVESAIRATHLLTGIAVVCQDERSQLHNKDRAIKNLKEKVTDFYNKKQEEIEASERKTILASARTTQVRTYDFTLGKVTDKAENIETSLAKILVGNLDEILVLKRLIKADGN